MFDAQVYLSALCRVVPHHIVEEVLTDPTERALRPQRFPGSVLVVDMVGFTSLCTRLTLDGRTGLSRLSTFLDRLFEGLELEAIFPFGGYIVQFAGDALVVVFRGEDHALRALAAALTIQRRLEDLVQEPGGAGPLMLRIGLARGEVFLNVFGDITQRVAVCAGPAVRRALELQHRAQPGALAVDDELAVALEPDLVPGERGPADLRRWPAPAPLDQTYYEQHFDERVDDKLRILESFIPPPLARRIRGTPHGWRLRGEVRQAVVQFIDLEGFSEKPELIEVAMNLSRSLLRGFRKYDGVVLKAATIRRGHRIMVLYGLARPAEHDAERALMAALEGQARLRAFAAGHPGMPLSMRSGTHLGEIYLGSVGSWYRHDVTAIGDAVNLAARLAETAEPFEALISDEVRARASAAFRTSRRGPLPLRGRSEPADAHLVHAPAEELAHYVQRRGSDRFHAGRGDEVRRLEEIVSGALVGRGRVLGITGEAGTGKSHLLAALVDRWIEGGGVGMVGRCRFATRNHPLAPLASMLAAFVGLTGADSDEERTARIRRRMEPYAIGDGMEDLLALLQPVHRPDELPEALLDLSDAYAQQRVLDAVIRFVQQRTREVKPLYVLEDLHHADSLTLQLARRLTALGREDAFLLVTTFRPDPRLDDLRRELDEELLLGPLERQQCAALVCHELSAHSVDPDLDSFFWSRTAGNPAMLTEVVRFLADRMLLNVQGGTVAAAEPGVALLEDLVPDSWQHVALARLEGLGELERGVLRTASAIGLHFDSELLQRISDPLGAEAVTAAIDSLEAQDVIAVDWVGCADPGGGAYRFRDEVVRATAYSLIPELERRQLHRRIADTLERHLARSRHALDAVLGHHRERAGQWAEAAQWYARAAERTARAGLDREALFCTTRWRHAVDQLAGEERPPAELAARMEMVQLMATVRQGKPREVVALVDRLTTEHLDRLPPMHRHTVELYLAAAEAAQGELSLARRRFEALVEEPRVKDTMRADAAYFLAVFRHLALDREAGQRWVERGLALAPNDRVRRTLLRLLEARMTGLDGEIEPARALIARARQCAEEEGRQHLVAAATRELGFLALLEKDFERSRVLLHHALTLDRRLASWLWQAEDRRLLGQMYLWSREPEAAREHLEQAVMLAQEIGHELTRIAALGPLGVAVAWTRDPDAGLTMCEQAHRRASELGLRQVQLETSLYLLQVALDRGDAARIAEAAAWCEDHAPDARAPLYRDLLLRLTEQARLFIK